MDWKVTDNIRLLSLALKHNKKWSFLSKNFFPFETQHSLKNKAIKLLGAFCQKKRPEILLLLKTKFEELALETINFLQKQHLIASQSEIKKEINAKKIKKSISNNYESHNHSIEKSLTNSSSLLLNNVSSNTAQTNLNYPFIQNNHAFDNVYTNYNQHMNTFNPFAIQFPIIPQYQMNFTNFTNSGFPSYVFLPVPFNQTRSMVFNQREE